MEYLIFAGVILLLILLMMGKGYLDSKRSQKDFVEKLHKEYGAENNREYKSDELNMHISMYYKKHREPYQIDDITWNDLNLDDVYRKMNYSHSAAGDEYLYYKLRTPVQQAEELELFESHVRYFMEHEDERVAMQVQFARLGRMGKYSLYEYLDYLDSLGERNSIRYYLAIILVFLAVSMMFYSTPAGLCALLLILCRNMIFYYKEQNEIEPYITSFHYIARLLEAAESIAREHVEEVSKEQKALRDGYKAMEHFRKNSFIVLSRSGGGTSTSSNLLEMLFDYLRMIFYMDLIKFNQMLRAVRTHRDEIDNIVTLIGKLESAIVVGEYRFSLNGEYCIPELLQESKETARKSAFLKMEQLYHPLLNAPVKNDIEVKRGVLLTGSNASGKSTFLRAAALNVILAQTIHTSLAASYQASVFQVYSSMSLQDNLESGDSYYMVEVKSIRRILERVREAEKNHQHVLCFVDEVLRGTNTVERIAASTQILRALAGENAICFAATHDLELTKLLADVYDNYHFEEEIVEDDIFFPYRLQKGAAVSRNAIALLKALGYEDGLVADAEAMAQDFLANGKWSGGAD